MKTVKRIMAIIAAVILVGLYVTTLIFAITDNPAKMLMFIASIVASVVIPVMIWVIIWIANLLRKKREESDAQYKKATTNLSSHLTIKKKIKITDDK